jgi:hypothetical protein
VVDRVGPVGGRAKDSTKKIGEFGAGRSRKLGGAPIIWLPRLLFFEGRAVSCHATIRSFPFEVGVVGVDGLAMAKLSHPCSTL